ncbi:hypothetical protein HDE_13169 [Halotydeus destructor]|nr:hypothetical protein HDE_13169 [Halotydeus destructor]
MLRIVAILIFTGHCLCKIDFEYPYDCNGEPNGLPEAMMSFFSYTNILTPDRITTADRELKDGVPRLTRQRDLRKPKESYVAAFPYSRSYYTLFMADHAICNCKQHVYPCRNCTITFGGFFKFLPNVQSPQEVKSTTDLNGTRILVVFDKPLVMGVFSMDGQQLEPFVYYPVGKVAPSQMSRIRQNDAKNVTLLLCFDQLCGQHDVDPSNLKKPLIAEPSRTYFWSRLLLGCPTDLCFDGSFDTATYAARGEKSAMLLIRGNYLYELNQLKMDATPPGGTLLQEMQIPRKNYDAAFRTRTENETEAHYLISEDTILYSQDELAYDEGTNFTHSVKDMNSTFIGFTGHVDAAWTLDNGTLHLLQGQVVYTYSPKSQGWSFLGKIMMSYLYPKVPSNIEAAMNSNGNIYFFKKTSTSVTTEGDFVGHDVTDRILGIRTMKQFVAYKTKLLGNPNPTSSPSSKSLLGLVIGVMAGMLFLSLAAIYCFLVSKKRPKSRGTQNLKSPFPAIEYPDFSQSLNTQSTAGPQNIGVVDIASETASSVTYEPSMPKNEGVLEIPSETYD